jgi:hypothetical protein
MRKALRPLHLTLFYFPLLGLSLSLGSAAQSYSRMEIGAQGASLLLTDPISGTDEKAGFGTRFTYNFSSIFSFDAEGDFFPTSAPTEPQRGGRAFAVLAGPKAGWRFTKFAVFVKARPGIINFSSAEVVTTGIEPNGTPFFAAFPGGHRSDLALDLGGILEINTSRRTMLRLDVGEMLVRYGDRTYPIPTTPVIIDVIGVVGNSLLVTAGFSYRLGEISQKRSAIGTPRRWEVGAQYGLLTMGSAELEGVPYFAPFYLGNDPGFGGRLTYNLSPWLAIESAVNYYYRSPNVGDAQRGGKILQGCFGPKAGWRTQRAGFFVKARPGFLSYGSVHDSLYPPYPTTRLTHFAVDLGAVLELYPSRRTMLRVDLSHTLAFFGPRTVLAPVGSITPNGNLVSGGFHDNGLQFMGGFGWRF